MHAIASASAKPKQPIRDKQTSARIELVNKLSTTATLVLSTAAALALFQLASSDAAKYVAATSAMVSAMATAFAWRTRAGAFADASRAYGGVVIDCGQLSYKLIPMMRRK